LHYIPIGMNTITFGSIVVTIDLWLCSEFSPISGKESFNLFLLENTHKMPTYIFCKIDRSLCSLLEKLHALFVFTHTHTHTHTYTYTHTYTHTYTLTLIHTRTHTHTLKHTHTYAHTRTTHTHTHLYTRTHTHTFDSFHLKNFDSCLIHHFFT